MVRIRGLGFAVVTAALAAASCQILAGGIGPRTFDGPTDDANAPTDSNSGPSDGTVVSEASAHDSSHPETNDSAIGAKDSATPPDSPVVDGGTFCTSLSPQPTFCDDFDTPPFLYLWNYPQPPPSMDTIFHKSSPNACLFSLPPVDTGAGFVRNSISKSFQKTFSTATLSFEVRPRNFFYWNEVAYIELSNGGAGPDYNVSLHIGDNGVESVVTETNVVTDSGGTTSAAHTFSAVPSQNDWTLIVLTVTIASGSTRGTVTLSFDGQNQEAFDIMAANATGTPTIALGAILVNPGMAPVGSVWAMDFDNVVFDLQ